MKKILFVCSANITRSFMAERIFMEQLRKAGRNDIEASSAGLLDMKGAPGDIIAAELLQKHGIPPAGHNSRPLSSDLVREADMIVVMEAVHKTAVLNQYPDAAGKIFLLKSFSGNLNRPDQDIHDCHKRSSYHYRLCFSEIFLAIEGLIKCI
jgi:protein-tyrosine phosphatase